MATDRSPMEVPAIDATAAEYALGTLRGSDRDIFEARLREDSALRSMVSRWEDLLMPMTAAVAPHDPPPAVWERIDRTLGISEARPRQAAPPPPAETQPPAPMADPQAGVDRSAAGDGPGPDASVAGEGARRPEAGTRPAFVVRRASPQEDWPPAPGLERELAAASRRAGRWRMAAVALGIVATILVLIVLVAMSDPDSPPGQTGQIPLTAVLSPVDASPVWSIRHDPEQGRLQVDTIQPGPGLDDQSYILWALMPDAGPQLLGELPPDRQTVLALSNEVASRLGSGVPLAVTLEPAGGSPTGQPTGSIVHTGRLEPFSRSM